MPILSLPSQPVDPFYRPAVYRYGAAVFAIALEVAIRLALGPRTGYGLEIEAGLIATAFAAWYGGTGPGLLAAFASAGATVYWTMVSGRGAEEAAAAALGLVVGALLLVVLLAAYERRLRQASTQIVNARQRTDRALVGEANAKLAQARAEEARDRLGAERAQLDQQLKASQERMQVAQVSARFCLFDWQHGTESIVVGGAAEPVMGSGAELLQSLESLLEKVHPEDRWEVRQKFIAAGSRGLPIDLEFRVVWPDGSTHWVAAKGSTLLEAGQPPRTIGIFQDITEKKATEQVLIRTEKLAAAGRLAAAVAHEINNPLAAAMNLLYIVREDPSLSRAGREYATLAEQELSRLGHISKQALGFYRESSHPVPVRVPELLDEVVDLYSRNMPAGITVERQYGPEVETRAVKGEIRQVFSNLLSNAVQAVGEQGTIRISARSHQMADRTGMVAVIEDNGPGIPPENLGQIFEPFFTTKPDLGTGLGLWLAKELTEKHGGSITVESHSEPDRHGTRFTVFLPAAAQSTAEASGAG